MINPKFPLKHLSVPSPNDVENPLISPSKISNIHQLLNGNEGASANSCRYKRRYSEHTVLSSEENHTKIPNWGRTERRHSIAIMTSVPNDLEVSPYLPSSSQSSHTLPPNALRHLYPQSHPHVHSLSKLSPHVYPQHHAQGQSLPFLATHYTHVHSVVGAPLATIEESPPHHIPTTTTTPRTSAAKNHVCTVAGCNMRFKRLEHLKRHMRVHTLERPFACAYVGCRKTFSRRDNLGQHMRTHERQALKQVQGDALMMAQPTIRSAPLGLGIGHAGHVRQKST
ncbi:hypothetical protein K7432_013660 [Basidiobolus ranarum]|uniref:C2H2-type domain-containing protein n=1 Tax=Basidiobolus ranarum TaxID=34480 RepID=A0ABR2WIU5_9FUNG